MRTPSVIHLAYPLPAPVQIYAACRAQIGTDMFSSVVTTTTAPSEAHLLRLTAAEAESFVRITAHSQSVQRHQQLFEWLREEIQEFLPHEILVSAHGHVRDWKPTLDIVSGLPGVRTKGLSQCSNLPQLIEDLRLAWVAGNRVPLLLRAARVLDEQSHCSCALHSALRQMHVILVHGVHDARDAQDGLYILFHQSSMTRGRPKDRFLAFVDLLLPQIDLAFRRVAPYQFADDQATQDRVHRLNLSTREQEILEWVSLGKTNVDIARALDISPFTVKNHVQRIYRKIGVTNRTQAAMKYGAPGRSA